MGTVDGVADKLERLREMRDEYESALDDAARLREEYHREVVKLHRSGVSLREIADALGISHQRVHQIVSPRDEGHDRPTRRKATSAVVASVLALSVVAAGAALVIRDRVRDVPTARPVAPASVPSRDAKRAACERFVELFRGQPTILENVDCRNVIPASLRGAVAVIDPGTGRVLALLAR
jgi:hypothetical protein